MSTSPFIAADIHDPVGIRRAAPAVLSLALMDARNATLQALSRFDGLDPAQPLPELDPPAWTAAQAARFQEHWILCFVQRSRGELCDPGALRLAPLDPVLDAWLDPAVATRAQRWSLLPGGDAIRAYLLATLEATQDLLDRAAADDDALYFYRLALWHEDRLAETLAEQAQALGMPGDALPAMPVSVQREALRLPAQRVVVGSAPGGFVPDGEKFAHVQPVPEFEIDGQPVGWAQYAEFVDDGGYDEPHWWSAEGWQWLQADGRRAPRYVEQFSGGVLLHRAGRLQRVPGAQAAAHLAYYEAEAWCRWAGRRLPLEAEWTAAATGAVGRGFAWGAVWEWMAGSARPYPGHRPGPAAIDPVPGEGGWRVQRGASWLTPARQRHPAARRVRRPEDDQGFCGFRSCAA